LKLVEELVMKDRVFALFSGIGTETSESAMPLLKSQGVPHFFIGSNARSITEPPRHGIFSMLPTPEVEARVLGQYVNSNHPGEKVILWFRDEPEYKAASKEIAQKLQGNPLQFLPSKAGSSQFKAEWEAIRAGNPRAVIALGPYAPLIKFLRAADVSGTPIYSGNALADSSLWRMLDSRIINRLRVLTSFPLLIESNHPGIRLHRALLREYAPDFKPSRWSIYGHSVAELMAEVLRRSGRDLNREGAIRSAENLKSWRGKLMPPVYLDRNQHLSMSFLRVSRIMPTKVVHLSEWLDGR
jgi:ABC-type branched-subunit amino acid transport system substrate-binding protein